MKLTHTWTMGLHVEKENFKEPKKFTLPGTVYGFQNFPCTLSDHTENIYHFLTYQSEKNTTLD